MKKLIGIGIAAMMVMSFTTTAHAYLLGASAKDSAGKNFMTALTFGDAGSGTLTQPGATDGTVEMALPGDQTWRSGATAGSQTWYYKNIIKPAPNAWVIALWGNNFAQSTATVKFWVSTLGNGGTQGAVIGGNWELRNLRTNEVVWSGAAPTATSTEASPWINVSLNVVNTSAPSQNADVYALQQVVPEPGSILALASGLAGLVGFGIRRRK